jgi:putative aldouronate transport system permease protein
MAGSESVSFEKIKRRKKMAAKDKIFYVFIYAFFVIFAVVILYPLVNMLAYSLNEHLDAFSRGIHLLPRKWSLENYGKLVFPDITILKNYGEFSFRYRFFIQGIAITVLRTAIGTFTALTANAFLAFILSRKKFLFKSGLSLFWVIAVFTQGGIVPLIPTYALYRYLHLNGSFWVYIIPGMISILYVMAIRTYMKSIPDSLEEAAQLEGAGYMRIFWNIISPLCKPVYAAIALFIASYHWNAWFDARLYNRFDPYYTTLQFELMKFFSELSVPPGVESNNTPTPYTVKAAAYIIAMIPVIIVYPFFQKYFVAGLKISGVKE